MFKRGFMNTQTSNIYKNTTISLCAALLATGKVELINAVKISPTQTEFHLSPKDTCDELEHLYLNDKLMVSASRIADKVQTLNTIKRGNQ